MSTSIENSSLHGQVVLITGGARRVGAEIARALHAAGARIMIHYRSSESAAMSLAIGAFSESDSPSRNVSASLSFACASSF